MPFLDFHVYIHSNLKLFACSSGGFAPQRISRFFVILGLFEVEPVCYTVYQPYAPIFESSAPPLEAQACEYPGENISYF
jgi:hypothetical protein